MDHIRFPDRQKQHVFTQLMIQAAHSVSKNHKANQTCNYMKSRNWELKGTQPIFGRVL